MRKAYLSDKNFLKEIDNLHNKEQYIKITALSFAEEKPIKEIQGIVKNGSLSLNGSSSVRRTGNISVVLNEEENNIEDYKNLFAINKKYEISVGFLNTTDDYKEETIIWFPMGVYLINSPSISSSENGIDFSAQLQDKMCLLNGTYGGTFSSPVTFHEMDEVKITKVDNGTEEQIIVSHPTIYQIILELVNHFGGVPISKIIIGGLDTLVKAPQSWNGETSKPLYRYKKNNEYYLTTDKTKAGKDYTIYKTGDEIGHVYTDFIWPTKTGGELTAQAGESITAILDKIVNLLGNFEYFFDVDGNFVFQEKRNYLNTTKVKTLENDMSLDYSMSKGNDKSVYNFSDSNLVTSFSNTPQFSQIKNDFVVWGERESSDGKKWPIRYHLAIDEKPTLQSHSHLVYWTQPSDSITQAKIYIEIDNLNSVRTPGAIYKYGEDFYMWSDTDKKAIKVSVKGYSQGGITSNDWRQELYLQGSEAQNTGTDTSFYYAELLNEWPKLYNVEERKYFEDGKTTNIDYFLDIIDGGAANTNMSVSSIGRRTKVLQQKESKVNCIFEPDIPDEILVTTEEEKEQCVSRGQAYIWVDTDIKEKGSNESYIMNHLSGGGKYNSAYLAAMNLLYQYTSYNNAITIQAIPIYYLEPNTRISVYDKKTGISGDYVINSISLPLGIDGTMSISATKAEQKM